MDKAKIAKLCNEIEDVACDIARITMNDIISAESSMIFDKAKEITAEITAPPKSNADRIRQMTDEELAKIMRSCSFCAYLDKGCQHNGNCTQGFLEWLKQEVKNDDER